MESDYSQFSEDEMKQQYRSQNLRGSLLDCFKKNKILTVKRNRQSVSSVYNSEGGETIANNSKENVDPDSHNRSQQRSLSNNSRSIPKNPKNTLLNKNMVKLPLAEIKASNIQIQRPISTKHNKQKYKPPECCQISIQTDTLKKVSLGFQTDPQQPSSAPSPQLLRISELEEQIFILKEKNRLEKLSANKLQIQCQKLTKYNKDLMQKMMKLDHTETKHSVEQLRVHTFERFQEMMKIVESKQGFFNQTLCLLENQIDKLQYKVEIACLKKNPISESQSLKCKISKYELQNQHLVSQLYMKSQQTYKYWQCLLQLSRYLEKTTIWNKVHKYYKDIDYDSSLYN